MRVYWCDQNTRMMHTAEAPDGALHLEIYATALPSGKEAEPIDMIDWDERVYTRGRGTRPIPFPEKTYEMRDLTWEPPLPEWAR